MSKVKPPTEKKRLADGRDHYNRNGENNKAWRKAKPLKKAKARRAFRKAGQDLLHVSIGSAEAGATNAARKAASNKQRFVKDWGAIPLRDFVETRRVRNELDQGAK